MAEGGIRDYHQAKLKAATRLGIHDDASLPRNREIEDALREYQRLFLGDDHRAGLRLRREAALRALEFFAGFDARSEEHTSELQSLMRISYAVFCLKKKKHDKHT